MSEATAIPGNEAISEGERGARRREIFEPYHHRIDAVIDRRLHAEQPTVLVSLHSFTPVYAGVARPWHIGALYNRDTVLPQLLLKHFRARAISSSATTSPMRRATSPTTPFPCMAKPAASSTPASRSART